MQQVQHHRAMTLNEARSWRVARDIALILSVVLFVAITAAQLIGAAAVVPMEDREYTYLKLPAQEQSTSTVSSGQPILLTKLADSDKPIECAEGLIPVPDTVLDPTLAWSDGRKIPRVVHVTSRSRCMTKEFAENIDKWRFKDHSLFMHDDVAMDKVLNRDWPEFPLLQKVLKCTNFGGAVKADIWRILILYEYGGIFTDIDNAPNKFNGTTIQPEDDAFFVVEQLGTPSQWFMAISPRHPMMYMIMDSILNNLFGIGDTGTLQVVWTTGPGAVAQGMKLFLRDKSRHFSAGHYTGMDGRSVRLVGNSTNQHEHVWRNMIKDKIKLYEKMNMTHLLKMGTRDPKRATNLTCLEHLYRLDEERNVVHQNSPQW
jgi:mannosyltransferase OCH1-like enzyme